MISRDYMDILSPLNFWGKDQYTGIPREELLGRIKGMIDVRDLALIITGVRRVGKTILSKQYLKVMLEDGFPRETTLYVNLDEPAFQPSLSTTLLEDIYASYRHFIHPEGKAFIVLDEVQNIQGWERWVRSMMDRNEDCFFIITGSSSSLMSIELGSLLTGRHIEQRLSTLSLKEWLSFQGSGDTLYSSRNWKERVIRAYLEFGGFPSVVLNQDPTLKMDQLKELYQSIINRDLVSRMGLRRVGDIRTIVPMVAQSVSQKVSATKLHKTLKNLNRDLSSATVNNYLSLLEEALLFRFLPIYSSNIKNRSLYPRKAYCVDTGMANIAKLSNRPIWGRLAENAVANRLFTKYGSEDIGYWKDDSGREVDFVIGRGDNVQKLVQVVWEISEERTLKREVDALRSGMERLEPEETFLIIGSGDLPEFGPEMKVISLFDWLLIE
ncbi:MAG: ATP-binding protein [Candidatus Thermoplasmatota archaeon]|jgi:hypothetical protein|nr:ATP-binding protein [Candidatus Thermoplasmatota archaeon]